MIYLQLFLSFLKIGAFSFGGGYAAMPMIQQQMVDVYHWLSVSEFGDLVTISQMTPGPIAINAATFVGIRVAGWQGALCATMGCVFPACVIVTMIAYFYVKYQISGSTYFYIDGVSYNTENGSRSESFSAARSFEVICGPVNKNFVARITLTQYRGAPASNATKISVSKNNGPFAIKASGQSSASYTINF